MYYRGVWAIGLLVMLAGPTQAQNFSQGFVFGDSTVDSGWWKGALQGKCDGAPSPCTTGNANKDNLIQNSINVGGGTGAPVGAGYLMNSQLLASFFGLTSIPANQPGGTNYAISGATDANSAQLPKGNLNPNPNLPSTSQQIANYLAANGGIANSSALYQISSGGNDITFVRDNPGLFPTVASGQAYLAGQAASLITAVSALQAAGARYLVIDNSYGGSGFANFYNQTLWTGLAAAGVQFIPADVQAMRIAVQANPTAFGFTAATVNPGVVAAGTSTGSACVVQTGPKPPGTASGWSQWCVNNTTPSSQHAYLASADAQQTYFFADDEHFSAAGQKIEADYIYSLIVAPSQISFLAENAVKARSAFIASTQNQIELSQDQRGPTGFNAWITGDVSHLSMSNYTGFPDDPSTPVGIAAGIDYRWSRQLIIGGVISTGTQRSSFSTLGGFTDDEIAASVYAGYRAGAWWGNVIGTYGHLQFAVDRTVPIGISTQFNKGTTSGENWSVATEGGYKFREGWFTHGPIVGIALQRVRVNDFTESGSFTSLSFGSQTRDSLISALGYRATIDWGAWRPFAQVVWNHELANTDRDVTAFLTTSSFAPGYSMPAVVLGKDWGVATVGTTYKLGRNVTALGTFTSDFGQRDVITYGGQLGINVAF